MAIDNDEEIVYDNEKEENYDKINMMPRYYDLLSVK